MAMEKISNENVNVQIGACTEQPVHNIIMRYDVLI